MPERIQLHRTKGWRKPEGAIVVSRPSKWGNPFVIASGYTLDQAVTKFGAALRAAVDDQVSDVGYITTYSGEFREMAASLDELRGHDLACWCSLATPCHADVLLELANA